MEKASSNLWECPYCKKKMLESAQKQHLCGCEDYINSIDLTCKWCGKKGFKRISSHTFHENRCYNNPNRKAWTFEGKQHDLSTKIKQAKSFIPKGEIKDFFSLSTRTRTKILDRMKMCCSLCGWSQSTVDLHHIKPRKNGGPDTMDNITPICPNCHRMVHNGLIESDILLSFTDLYGDDWKSMYLSSGRIQGFSSSVKKESVKICEFCNKEFKSNSKTQKYCSIQCCNASRKKVISKEELIAAIEKYSYKKIICKKLGISYKSLLAYLREYNLQTSLGAEKPKNSKHQSGAGNSNYGKVWIYNESLKISKSVPKYDLDKWLNEGWLKGRKLKFL